MAGESLGDRPGVERQAELRGDPGEELLHPLLVESLDVEDRVARLDEETEVLHLPSVSQRPAGRATCRRGADPVTWRGYGALTFRTPRFRDPRRRRFRP